METVLSASIRHLIRNQFSGRKWLAGDTPLEDQKPSHICTSVECSHPFVVICQDEHREWLFYKLSSQQQQL